jgi:phosphopantetheine--protein transferase-like protein
MRCAVSWDVVWFQAGHAVSPRLPAPHEVHVVEVDLASQLSPDSSIWQALTDSEHQRACRYRSDQARAQFVLCRSALRRWLGACLGLEPAKVSLTANENGKPQLDSSITWGNLDYTPPLYFNLAHTEGKGLIAFALDPVGVDVELIRPVPHMEGLIQRYFSPCEYAQWQSSPVQDRLDIFFRLWTGKEAVIKAVGRSLVSLRCFDLLLHEDGSATVVNAREPEFQGSWYIPSWKRDKYWVTVAVRAPER